MLAKAFFLCSAQLFCVFFLFAQNTITINGSVKDSIGNPIALASVTIINQNGAGSTFSKTDVKGLFKCDFNANSESYSIKVTAMGYQPFIQPIEAKNQQYLNIILKQNIYKLNEITVKSNIKISLSSDTLKYNVDGFKESNDRVIGDVINRLPGIQIDENGAISYNGKRITNVYIDGDNLLDGRYKMATNNVPVGSVAQVQVIERDQPIKTLNGFVSSNNVSLNIKLTDSARTMTVNTGYAGAGNKAYTGELNNLIFNKSVKAINNLKANNIGENLEAEQASIGGSFNNEVLLKTPQTFLSMESETLPELKEKYYLMNNDISGSINTLIKLKADWGLRLNLSTLQLKRTYKYSNTVNYFWGNADTIRYLEVQHNVYQLKQWRAEAQIEKNSKSIYVKSITKFEMPRWDRNGNTMQNDQRFGQHQPTNHQSVSNETSVIKALGISNILQYNGLIQYYKVDESLQITPGIQEEIVNNGLGYLVLNQQANTRNVFINQSATFKTKFNRFVLSVATGVSYESNLLKSKLLKTDSTYNVVPVGGQFENNVDFKNSTLYGKSTAMYFLEKGLISLEVSPSFSNIGYTDTEKKLFKRNTYFLINPTLEVRKNSGKYGEVQARFAQQNQFGQVNDIYSAGILVNYRQFNFNSTPLPETDISTFNIRYSYRKPIKMLFYNTSFSYERTKQNFINAFTIDSGLTKSIAIDFRNKLDQYSLNGNMSKYLFRLELNFSARGSLKMQKGNSYYNDAITPFRAYQLSTGITLRKKVFSTITLLLSGDISRSINKQASLNNGFIINETANDNIKAEWLHNISSKISYTLAYHFVSYRQTLQPPIRNQFLDFNLRFAPTKWKSFFEFQCINLINQNEYKQINLGTNLLSTYQMQLRDRTFLLKYAFTF